MSTMQLCSLPVSKARPSSERRDNLFWILQYNKNQPRIYTNARIFQLLSVTCRIATMSSVATTESEPAK